MIFNPSGERGGQIVDGAVAGVSLNPPTRYVHGGGEVDLELGTESSIIAQFSKCKKYEIARVNADETKNRRLILCSTIQC